VSKSPRTLEDASQVFEMFFATSSLAMAFFDRSLRIVHLNAAFAAFGGRPVADYLGRTLAERLPEIALTAEPYMRSVIEMGSPLVGMRFTIGGRRWVTSHYPVRRAGGEVLGVGIVGYDDTERQEALRKLHESEQRYHTLVELGPDGIVSSENERFTYVNPAAAEILGARDPSELIGRSIWDLQVGSPPVPAGMLEGIVVANENHSYDAPVRRLDGKVITLSVRSVHAERDGVPVVHSVFRDVTQQRFEQREREELMATLATERTLFSTVIRQLPVGVVLLDADGQVVLRNDSADRIWGGQWDLSSLPPGGCETVAASASSACGPKTLGGCASPVKTDLATELVCGDGEARSVRGSVVPIEAADGTQCCAVATFWDVTALARAQGDLRRAHDQLETRVAERTASLAEANERLRDASTERETAERQLRMAERLASIGTLAAGVAHEINNPLAAIVASAELARAMCNDDAHPEEVDAALARIMDEAHRAGEIVKGLLRFGRGDLTERWPIDSSEVVRGLVGSSRLETALGTAKVRTRLTRNPTRVVMNPTELEQIVLNLIQNAVKADAKKVTVQTAVVDGHVRIVVKDDGHGIEDGNLERIFDPFFTTHPNDGGMGLGLSVVHGIVTRCGGRIEVESRPGRGTTFTVKLPSAMQWAQVS
jgi:PAS domain S-box-containing protein